MKARTVACLFVLTGMAQAQEEPPRLEPAATLDGYRQSVNALAFNPDGTRLVTGSAGTETRPDEAPGGAVPVQVSQGLLTVWNVADRKEERSILLPGTGNASAMVTGVAWSPDGRWVAARDTTSVRVWASADWTERPRLSETLAPGTGGIRFTLDGALLVASEQSGLKFSIVAWSTPDFAEAWRWNLAHVPQGFDCGREGLTVASGPVSMLVRESGSKGDVIEHALTDNGTPQSIAVASAGDVVAMGGSGLTLLTRQADGSWKDRKCGKFRDVCALVFSPDSRRLAISHTAVDPVRERFIPLVTLLELQGERVIAELAGHEEAPRALAFSADGRRLASAGSDRCVKLWEVGEGAKERK